MTLMRNMTPRRAALGLCGALIWLTADHVQAQVPTPPTPPREARELPPALPAPPRGEQLPNPETGDMQDLTALKPRLLQDARSITEPGDRALALARIARSAIFSGQAGMAHDAIIEGGEAAQLVTDPLVHDQRIEAIILAALQLAEERVRPPLSSTDAGTAPAREDVLTPARREQFRLAAEEWRYAAKIARAITSPVTRTEASHRVVEGASLATQAMGGSPDQSRPFTASVVMPEVGKEVREFIRNLLTAAAEEAARIERPVWRDRALVSVAQNAAKSDQADLAIAVARMIPQPEIRTDALLRIAETQSRSNRKQEASEAYNETAKTIAMIPLEDPREVLTGVLIDSLISVGRFDDARAATVLYEGNERRSIALAAVAESQGRRGLAASARIWIDKEPPELRSLLYRKLNDGVLTSLERSQSKISITPPNFTEPPSTR